MSAIRESSPPEPRFNRFPTRALQKLLPAIFVFLAFLSVGQAVEAACGGSGEEPCSCSLSEIVLEGCEVCRGARFKIPGVDQCTDTSGWPASCGGTNEPICSGGFLQTLGIGACKPGRINVAGTCRIPDSDGYPTFCGGSGERPCRLNEKFPACKLGLLNIGGTCTSLATLAIDSDGYPRACGDIGEPVCLTGVIDALLDIGIDIEACKPQDPDTVVAPFGICIIEDFPEQCGRNGQRACEPDEHFPTSCMSGLLEMGEPTIAVCGKEPRDWGESDGDEPPRGGPRTVFYIHGRGADHSELGTNGFAKRLLETSNVEDLYGIDWNNAGAAARKLSTRKLLSNATTEDEEWGYETFDQSSFRITDVAYGAAQAIRELDTESEITLIGGSFGGIMARQIVYRHYDELRAAGKKIAEVITFGSPHRGGLSGDIDYDARVAELQTRFACLASGDRNGCQLGQWIEWMDERERGSLFADPWYIDDRGYPQIRWVTLTSNGTRLALDEVIDPVRGVADNPAAFLLHGDANELVDTIEPWSQGSTQTPFPDSDGTVTVRSAFGIESDECYPFVRSGSGGPTIVPLTGASGDTALCRHATARSDGRFEEGELDADGVPDVLDGVDHADSDDVNIQGFIVAALNIAGDSDGDGDVDADDLVAEAGADYATECTGSTTIVNLDASDSFTGTGEGLLYVWTGPFGTAEGVMASVSLPLGEHSIALEITDPGSGLTSSDVIVVDVRDTTPPSVDDGLGFTLEATSASGAPFDIAAQGSDACSDVTIETLPDLVVYPLGATEVTVTATDASGNQTSGTVSVEVVDTTPPELTLPGDVLAEANAVLSTVAVGSASATDFFPSTVSSNAPAAFPLGDTLVVWTATDENGNVATGSQLVRVVDTTPPALVVPPDVIAEASAVDSLVAIGAASASDIFPATISSDAPPVYPLGTTQVGWTARDANGNEAAGSQSVTVADTTPPSISAPPDVVVVATAEGGPTPVELGSATATDIFGASVTSDAPSPASFPVGPTTVTWTAVDANGNEATATQRIEVIYQFEGFASPVQPGGTYKANRTLPLKFRLSLADGAPVTSAVAGLSVHLVGGDASSRAALDIQADEAADEGARFRYNGNHFQFNLSTNGWTAGLYRVVVDLSDGRSYPMEIVLE